MKRTKIAFGLLIAGVGAISSAFTVKITTHPAGWYSVTGHTIEPGSLPSFTSTDVLGFFTNDAANDKPTESCSTDTGFVCGVYYNEDLDTPVTYVTGEYAN